MQVWTSQDMEEEKVTQGWGAGVSVTHGRRKKDPGSQSCGSSGRKDTGARRAESIRENRTPTASDAIAIDRSGRLEAIAVGNKGVSQARGKKMSEEEDGRAGRLGRRGRQEESQFLTWEAVWVMLGAKLSSRNQLWTEPM